MVRFEVAQVSVHRWTPQTGGKSGEYVFLEVSLDKISKTSCFGFRKRLGCPQVSTKPIEEAEEMQWRTYNEEGFLVALFSLQLPHSRMKKGDKLTIAVDACRASINHLVGARVARFKGAFCLGVWGPVTLQAVEGKGFEAAEVVLETRPTTTRPFSLESARPLDPIVRMESFIKLRCGPDPQAGCPRGQRRRSLVSFGGPRLSKRRCSGESEQLTLPNKDAAAAFRRRSSQESLSMSAAHHRGSCNSPAPSSRRSIITEAPHHWSSEGRRSVLAEASVAGSSRRSVGAEALHSVSTTVGSRRSVGAEVKWRNLLGMAPSRRPCEAVSAAFRKWRPEDWNTVWKDGWPGQSRGGQSIEVVPLMEAEFRRDCIILFNTLFPCTKGAGFDLLRNLALDSVPSKVQFRPVSMRGQGSKGFRSFTESVSSEMDEDTVRRATTPPSRSMTPRFRLGSSLTGSARLSADQEGSEEEDQWTEPRGSTSTWFCRHNLVPDYLPQLFVDPNTGAVRDSGCRVPEDVPSMCLHGSRTLGAPTMAFLDEYSPRIMLLKRLLICFAACGVYYSEAPNSAQLGDLWPYPLASLLGHGSRILICLEDVEPSELINFLLLGDPQRVDWKEAGVPWPLQWRMAATHSVEITETGELEERKLRVHNPAETVQNLSDGMRKKHLGLNLPIGGVGNSSPMGPDHIIGFHGEVLARQSVQASSRRSSLGSMLRKTAMDSTVRKLSGFVRSSASAAGPQRAQRGGSNSSTDTPGSSRNSGLEGLRVVGNVQCGHLYIRTDDFGEVASAVHSSSSSSRCPAREEMRRALRERPSCDLIPVEQARMQLQVESTTSKAGELLFPSSVLRLRAPGQNDAHTVSGNNTGKLNLIRVQSAPSLTPRAQASSSEDVRWVHQAMLLKFSSAKFMPPPPSVTALRMLLEDYDPLNVQLYGSAGRFKSIEDFYTELTEMTSYLGWSNGQLERFCEPVILQLCWNGYVLMKTHEHLEGKLCPARKNSFIATRLLPSETWRRALGRIVCSELGLPEALFLQSLLESSDVDEECHEAVQETTMSPSFPGLLSSYMTHMVRWDIKDEKLDLFRSHGLPVAPEGDPALLGSHFATTKSVVGRRRIFWKWTPFTEAQKLMTFVNISEATADNRWARYAFQKEGAVQFPPTEAALAILLRRCGVDASALGRKGSSSLYDLWLELANEESRLLMSKGQLVRVVEVIVLRLRWRPLASAEFRVLVCVPAHAREEETPAPNRRLPSTRRRKDETWIDAATRLFTEDLGLSAMSSQVRSLLTSKAGDRTERDFREERGDSEDYPGVECLRRTHLVTVTLREEAASSPLGKALGLRFEEALLARFPSDDGCSSRTGKNSKRMVHSTSSHASTSSASTASVVFSKAQDYRTEWLQGPSLERVAGAELWLRPPGHQVRRRLASVLVGLEGAAPGMKSPFGNEHDVKGTSAEISALGNRKWRFYRAQGALQIPSDVGGLRMRITRRTFLDVVSTCEHLDLSSCSTDLAASHKHGLPRWLLDQRFAERELFKSLLGGSGREALEALTWMKEYRATHRTPGQAFAAMRGRKATTIGI